MLLNTQSRPRHGRMGRCGDCRQLRRVFDLDGTRWALCTGCIADAIASVEDLLSTRELYEGRSAAAWLEDHRNRSHNTVGCCWCGIGLVA